MHTLAHLDASGNADQLVQTNDPAGYPGFIDAAGGGYRQHWTGSAWQDTAAAQTWRAQQATADGDIATKTTARQHSAAVASAVAAQATAAGMTMDEVYLRLHVDAILAIPVPSRTARQKQFLQIVAAADAATP